MPRMLSRRISVVLAVFALSSTVLGTGTAGAATAPGLGTADSYAILAGTTVTNTNPSVITGNLGVSPGSAVTGFPPGVVQGGVIDAANAAALQAQSDLTTAYNEAAGAPKDFDLSAELGSPTPLVPGTYTASSALQLTGSVTLDGLGNPNSVFIFQIPSSLTTASNAVVDLIGNASPCNVFWQVGSSAILGTTTTFVGTIMALTSITVGNSATIQGRALARNGQVSLDNNVITRPQCGAVPTTTTGPPVTTAPVTTAPVTTTPVTTTAPTTTSAAPVIVAPPVVVLPDLPAVTIPPATAPPVVALPGLPPIAVPGGPPAVVLPAPDVPVTPGNPDLPVLPLGPDVPVTPGLPFTPSLPGLSNSPDLPISPGIPDSLLFPGSGQVTAIPLGGVDTGDGSTAHRA